MKRSLAEIFAAPPARPIDQAAQDNWQLRLALVALVDSLELQRDPWGSATGKALKRAKTTLRHIGALDGAYPEEVPFQ